MPNRTEHARSPGSKSALRVYFVLGTLTVLAGLFVFHHVTDTSRTGAADDAGVHADVPDTPAGRVEAGRVLAGQYCQSCHGLPDPSLLDARTWEHGILPTMGPRLGIFRHGPVDYSRHKYDWGMTGDFFPTSPLLTETQWQRIIDYYVASSPASLAPQVRTAPITMGLPLFSAEAPSSPRREPFTCFVKIIEGDGPRRLVVSDAESGRTQFLNDALAVVDAVQTTGPVVNAEVDPGGGVLVCNVGQITPNNGTAGQAQRFSPDAAGRLAAAPVTLFDGLRRPVQVAAADLNGDGTQDFLVCEFGSLLGGLSWMEQTRAGGFTKHPLSDLPGAVKATFHDHNGDGRTDIWALFAQGQEGVFLFTNKGGGTFRQEQVLQFPPSYGSTHLELADFNGDGHADLVYTAGDNGDESRILKPYHGVYVFINDGANHFEQRYFFPIHGCYKALARDFDGDGDLDLATISCFADDPRQPEEAFVYLENVGGLEFRPYSIEAATRGRWMAMDAGDVDGDGDIDLVLGNFSMPSPVKSNVDWTHAPPFLLLRNNGKGSKG